MDNPSFDSITVLIRVKEMCCRAYRKKLKKELSKLAGVHSIAIDSDKNLVSVRGKVNPSLLLDTITSKTGKDAEIVSTDKNPQFCRNYKKSQRRKFDLNKGYRCDKHYSRNNIEDEYGDEEHHNCEPYVPPPYDERVCRDYYCTLHNMRPIFSNFIHANDGYYAHVGFGGSRTSVPWFDEYGYFGHGGSSRGCTLM